MTIDEALDDYALLNGRDVSVARSQLSMMRSELDRLRLDVAALTHLRELHASKKDPTILEALRMVTYAADEVLEYDEGHRVFRLMRAVSVACGLLGTGTAGWGSALAAKGFQFDLVLEARPNTKRGADPPPAEAPKP